MGGPSDRLDSMHFLTVVLDIFCSPAFLYLFYSFTNFNFDVMLQTKLAICQLLHHELLSHISYHIISYTKATISAQ